jgi:hypothetical protein
MTARAASVPASQRNVGRSVWAIVAGFIAITALSLMVDEILHLLHVYPPWGVAMWDPKLNALALGYRLIIDTAGSYLTAKLAPYAPLRHAMIGGFIGLALSLLGGGVAVKAGMGPLWYPVVLALSSPITAWIGGRMFVRNSANA